jgi:sugar phosphate isomerase/epimerase
MPHSERNAKETNMNVPDTQIAVQLYNFRDHCKTQADLANTLKQISDIGYRAVQMVDLGPDMPVEAVAALLEENDLYCCSTHEMMPDYTDHFERTVHTQRTYGCALSFLAIAINAEYYSAEGTKALAAELNQIGRKLKDQGIGFGYHNHHVEFARFTDKTMLEELVDNTDPELVAFEIDVHWVQRGGGSPVEWIKNVAGRIPVVHFKDYSIVSGETFFDTQPAFSEIGEGNLHWEGILAACRDANVRWYVTEQDQPMPGRSIFESARISYQNMVSMGLK